MVEFTKLDRLSKFGAFMSSRSGDIEPRILKKIVYKMAASGRKEVASDVKFGAGASFIELYLWSKFGDPSSYGVQTLTASRRRRRRSTRPMP